MLINRLILIFWRKIKERERSKIYIRTKKRMIVKLFFGGMIIMKTALIKKINKLITNQ